ncbi:stromal membrane-associated protein 1 isoform X6 [Manis pentadactyla]|uniref:stromal membrane-associated protein 1 isoform X6 n=1 Tax=Manis pentadactyla TaxID=143292 RepID=UPI00255CE618|nr:stromal membrane-associated protein 1 isoform X6 [Manis pentadactyla]
MTGSALIRVLGRVPAAAWRAARSPLLCNSLREMSSQGEKSKPVNQSLKKPKLPEGRLDAPEDASLEKEPLTSPRWASWNIGVFICIRCAGIHRNLGVHISRVKSVNLDQWTPEQIQCMQDMGNTKARLLYEANLPENFRRPQTDQAVEFFIRDKYEKKKYYDKNAIAITNLQKKEDQQLEPKKSTSPKKAPEPTVDLLGLDGPAEAPVTNGNTATVPALNDDLDIFGPMISNPLPATATPPGQGTSSVPAAATLSIVTTGDLDLFGEQIAKSDEVAKKQLSMDSILSLYGAGAMRQQSAPGVFMGPTGMPFTSQAPAGFQAFPSMGVPVPAAPGLMGNVMGQSTNMLVGMPMPNGFLGSAQTGATPLPQTVVGPQGGMGAQMGAAQSAFGQWNLSQVNQQMAGMSVGSGSPAAGLGPPPPTAAGWAGSAAGQTLSTQLWK